METLSIADLKALIEILEDKEFQYSHSKNKKQRIAVSMQRQKVEDFLDKKLQLIGIII